MHREDRKAKTENRKRATSHGSLRFLHFPLFATLLLASLTPFGNQIMPADELARGVVFQDNNENRQYDPMDTPLENIRVSNGREIVSTDSAGKYELPIDDDDILFVIKPRGWRTPLSTDKLPQFYYVHKPHGSPKLAYPGVEPTGPLPASVDFPLYPQQEPDQFRALMFGDPQPKNEKEVGYIAHDVVQELIGTEASFGVTLGDIVSDDLSLFEPLTQSIALIGIPWYNVIGNHDVNSDARNDHHSDESFERVFGPAYYSFDYGPVHFLVLDDVEWFIPEDGGSGSYRGGLGTDQMSFIRADLRQIPPDQLVVLMMHVPLVDVHDRHELYRLIEQRPFCMSISAHVHRHVHRWIDHEDGWRGPEPHHHVMNVTVSGSWWRGNRDDRGIPHTLMADGAPNGYSIMEFDGTRYDLRFKAAGRPAEYQMEIHAPDAVPLENIPYTVIYANVFNGSSRTKVELRWGDQETWIEMERVLEVDPGYRQVYNLEQSVVDKNWLYLPTPKISTHLWRAQLPSDMGPGAHLLQVRATEHQGQIHQARRAIRITRP